MRQRDSGFHWFFGKTNRISRFFFIVVFYLRFPNLEKRRWRQLRRARVHHAGQSCRSRCWVIPKRRSRVRQGPRRRFLGHGEHDGFHHHGRRPAALVVANLTSTPRPVHLAQKRYQWPASAATGCRGIASQVRGLGRLSPRTFVPGRGRRRWARGDGYGSDMDYYLLYVEEDHFPEIHEPRDYLESRFAFQQWDRG